MVSVWSARYFAHLIHKLMDEMSKISSTSYRHHLLEDPNFIKYFNTVTPQKILEKLFIGSRPAKRKKTKNIKNLRAIPWVFAWTQIRFILPAWPCRQDKAYLRPSKNPRNRSEVFYVFRFFSFCWSWSNK